MESTEAHVEFGGGRDGPRGSLLWDWRGSSGTPPRRSSSVGCSSFAETPDPLAPAPPS